MPSRLATASKFIRRGRPASPASAVLYRSPECGLCDEARSLLDRYVRAGRLELQEVDITADPDLAHRYGLIIPVLEIDGCPPLEWPFDRRGVEKALAR